MQACLNTILKIYGQETVTASRGWEWGTAYTGMDWTFTF